MRRTVPAMIDSAVSMHLLYLISVWLHILAATVWLGGMAFLVLVVVPWMRRGDRAAGAAMLRETGTRFSRVSFVGFAVIALTGTFNAYHRGVRLPDLVRADFVRSPFGTALWLKLGLFLTVLALSIYHDFVIGPRATDALVRAPASPEAMRLRRTTSLLGRLNALLALALYAVGVVLVRGCPL